MESPLNTFSDFRAEWAQGIFEPGLEEYAEHLVSDNPHLDEVLNLGPCSISILSPARNKMLFFSKAIAGVTGHNYEDIVSNRKIFTVENMHPEDLDVVIPQNRHNHELFTALPMEQRLGFIRRFFYRFRSADGSYRQMMEQNLVLMLDRHGQPDLVLGTVTHVQSLENEAWIAELELEMRQTDYRKYRFRKERLHVPLTNKEIFILEELAKGTAYTQICTALELKPKTVMAILQNIMLKTECRSTAEMLGRFSEP